jgi:hypothetical protein
MALQPPQSIPPAEGLNAGDVAWMLTASSMVLFMTPGLAFFYGGMVSAKNVISTMLQCFIALGLVSILWMVIGSRDITNSWDWTCRSMGRRRLPCRRKDCTEQDYGKDYTQKQDYTDYTDCRICVLDLAVRALVVAVSR